MYNHSDKFHQSISDKTISSSKNAPYLLVIRCLSIYALVLIIVGTLGNLLTIIVLLRKNLRRLATIRYLIVVSICDTISLYGWNLNNFYKFTISSNNDDLEELSLTNCRFISFMTFVSLQLSSWCLTAVSLGKNKANIRFFSRLKREQKHSLQKELKFFDIKINRVIYNSQSLSG